MNEKIKIFIADDNTEYVLSLVTYFNVQEDMKIVATARDGKEAIEKIQTVECDVILLDTIMPHLDGLSVLEEMNKRMAVFPICIMLSLTGLDKIVKRSMDLGAKAYMIKPFETEELAKKIRELVKNESTETEVTILKDVKTTYIEIDNKKLKLEEKVINIIHDLEIPANIKGYYYLQDGIIVAVKDIGVVHQITKQLYPKLATKYKTTPSCVQRAIRHAIGVAWNRGQIKKMENIFGYMVKSNRAKQPTNSEFIAIIAEKLRMENKKRIKQKSR